MAQTPAPSAWEQRMLIPALTHVLIHPTVAPSLHSQLFVSSQIPPSQIRRRRPDYYPPLLSTRNSDLLAFSLSLFLRRLRRRHLSSWRSKCPFQQPPPLVLSTAVDPAPATWGPQERRGYVWKRLRRGRLGIKVPTLVAVAGPNLALLLGFLWDPMWMKPRPRECSRCNTRPNWIVAMNLHLLGKGISLRNNIFQVKDNMQSIDEKPRKYQSILLF